MSISIIIAVYNEAQVITKCLESLQIQTIPIKEIIVVDDDSTDSTYQLLSHLKKDYDNLTLLKQSHQGPGAARNYGAHHATGEIFVFIDADMVCDEKYIENLVRPIQKGITKGTFTKDEYVANWENVWARCWNYNSNLTTNRRIPENYSDNAVVFRAILAKEFNKVGGFSQNFGWTDDWTLYRKLGYMATLTEATCYHYNPDTLFEVYRQAMWIGKNEFISGNRYKAAINLVHYSLPISFILGIVRSFLYITPHFIIFKLVYDLGITGGIILRILNFHKNK